MKRELPQTTRKPYEAPKLSVYGDIREITRSNRPTGHFDNPAMAEPDKRAGGP